jgi:hypothetical protein
MGKGVVWQNPAPCQRSRVCVDHPALVDGISMIPFLWCAFHFFNFPFRNWHGALAVCGGSSPHLVFSVGASKNNNKTPSQKKTFRAARGTCPSLTACFVFIPFDKKTLSTLQKNNEPNEKKGVLSLLPAA